MPRSRHKKTDSTFLRSIRYQPINAQRQLRRAPTFNRERYLKQLLIFSRICALLALLIGAVALTGWIEKSELLESVFSHLGTMKSNTAIAVIFASIALLLTNLWTSNKFFRFLRELFSLCVFLIGFLTVCEYIFHLGIGIDQLPYLIPISTQTTRMAPNSSLILIFIGLSLLTTDLKIRNHYVSHRLALLAGLILLPSIIGYIYGTDFIYAAVTRTKISVPTVISYLALVLGTLVAKPTNGTLAILTRDSAGGFLARRMLITSIITPLLFGGLILAGFRLQFYDSEFLFLALVSTCIIVFSILIWRNALSLHDIDISRRQNERNIVFLTEASKVLASSLEYNATLRNLAKLAVPYIADWCSITMLNEEGKPKTVALAHKDPRKVKWARELEKKNPPDMHANTGIAQILRTGKAEMYPVITDKMLTQSARDPEQVKLLRTLNLRSIMMVPITTERKPVGVITFISSDSDYHYSETDFAMAQELAIRAGIAIENATLYKRAQTAIRTRDEFISLASHELKTPLTSLKAYIQVAAKKLQREKHSTASYMIKMDSQVDKLANLIQDLLDVSKIQVGKLAFNFETFSLNDLVKETIDNVQQTTTHHTISYVGSAASEMYADKDRIGQVITNLLTNAIKYSPQADTVVVTGKTNETTTSVSVQDFGIGIDKKYLNRIFNRFYQVRGQKEQTFPGLGMGLYISKEIVTRHGGNLTVTSEKNKGSIFTVTLPLKASQKITPQRQLKK